MKAIFLLLVLGLLVGMRLVHAGENGPFEPVVVGTQPLAIPVGTVAAVMARDTLLQERLAKFGVTVAFLPFAKGKEINNAMNSGKVQLAFAGDMPTLEMAAAGAIVVPVLAKMAFSSIIAREIMTVQGLKGRRIANANHSSAHYTLLAALHHEGLDEKDVTLVNMEVGGMIRALANGEVDAFAAWEPVPGMALATHPDYFVVHRGLTFSFFYFDKRWIHDHPGPYRELLAGYVRAVRWMGKNPDHLEQACHWNMENAAAFSTDPMAVFLSQCVTITGRDLLSPSPQGRIPPVILQQDGLVAQQFHFLQRIGKIPMDLSVGKVLNAFDTAILEQVLAEPERYQLDDFVPLQGAVVSP